MIKLDFKYLYVALSQMLVLWGRKAIFLLVLKVRKKTEAIKNLGDNEHW